jgi:hypothetical protein
MIDRIKLLRTVEQLKVCSLIGHTKLLRSVEELKFLAQINAVKNHLVEITKSFQGTLSPMHGSEKNWNIFIFK